MSDALPVFSSFGADIYLSDFINNAIDRIASEISKIDIKSIVDFGDRISVQNDDITRLFKYKPNPLQTTSDFLSCVEWIRRKQRNCFIYPQYETVTAGGREFKKYTAFWPLNPASIRIGVNDGAVWEVEFSFNDGTIYTLPYSELIHLKWRRGSNTIIGGGDDYGLPNDYDVRRVLDALDKTIQGLPKSIESSLQIKGVYTANNLIETTRLNEMREDFENHILASKAGITAVDIAGTFTPVNINPPEISDKVYSFLKSILSERYGISMAILSGNYDSTKHAAFYQNCIEDFKVQFEQAMTSTVFSQREQDVGHQIRGYYGLVQYMSNSDKIQVANISKETGMMTVNQLAEMFGMEPFEGGDRRLQSLNYVNINDIDLYQKGKAGVLTDGSNIGNQ
jgi:hypothetical protein